MDEAGSGSGCLVHNDDRPLRPPDFPGYAECARARSANRRAECLEEGLANDIVHRRFIPYVQLHEFEALLFSDPREFEAEFPDRPDRIAELVRTREQFPTPEDIDDGAESAPSKRIRRELPDYGKVAMGPGMAKRIGLPLLRQQCPHFGQWIEKIEAAARS